MKLPFQILYFYYALLFGYTIANLFMIYFVLIFYVNEDRESIVFKGRGTEYLFIPTFSHSDMHLFVLSV